MRGDYDPNRRPFPRGVLLEPFGPSGVHPLFRRANEETFRKDNPHGYQHDLGAQDVFLDNFGMLVSEQFNSALRDEYVAEIGGWMELANPLWLVFCVGRPAVAARNVGAAYRWRFYSAAPSGGSI